MYCSYKVGLGNGYQYIQESIYDAHIKKNGNIVVNHTIVSLDVVADFIVGLRKPAKYLECENGTALIIRVSNTKAYFILNMESGEVQHYSTQESFSNQLKSLGLAEKVELNYSSFERKWSFGDNMDLSTCKSLEKAMGAAVE